MVGLKLAGGVRRDNSQASETRLTAMRKRQSVLCCLLAVALLAGCSSLFGGDDSRETLTQVPLDNDTPAIASTTTPTGATPTATTPTQTQESVPAIAAGESRYRSLRPTCDRPPELVVAIQVNALRYNDPQVNEGINTTFQFASPENRAASGPLDNFVTLITTQYEPLLNAETVTYGPLSRQNGTASQRITVETSDGLRQSYTWRLERQSGGEYDGCWLTSSVLRSPTGSSPSS